MVERRRETNMEKLELLSQTAILKQGIDRSDSGVGDGNASDGKCEKMVLLDSSNRLMTGIHIFPHTQQLLSAAAAAGSGAVPSGNSRDRRSRTTSPSFFSANSTTMVGSNIASPVSTDGEDEDVVGEITRGLSIPSSKLKHNQHSTKACIIESRSPVTTLEYGHKIAAAPSSPFTSSPAPYGFSFLPNPNHSLHQHQSQEHQEYPAAFYHNHNGNMIRTLSEASFAPQYGNNVMPTNSHTGAAATINSESGIAFQPPQQQQAPPPRLHLQQRRQSSCSHEDMARQIRELQEQLSEKDMVVSSLQNRVNSLENQIHELRQLPTGKISHIPVDDMIRIMQEYGSEISNQTLPQQRKQSIKKASIVRQFRRWNPNFFHFFLHHNGEWVPKLGREGELRRRVEKRRLLSIAKQNNNANGSR